MTSATFYPRRGVGTMATLCSGVNVNKVYRRGVGTCCVRKLSLLRDVTIPSREGRRLGSFIYRLVGEGMWCS